MNSSVSAGRVYWNVLNRERAGDYLGGTVQIIPHITEWSTGILQNREILFKMSWGTGASLRHMITSG